MPGLIMGLGEEPIPEPALGPGMSDTPRDCCRRGGGSIGARRADTWSDGSKRSGTPPLPAAAAAAAAPTLSVAEPVDGNRATRSFLGGGKTEITAAEAVSTAASRAAGEWGAEDSMPAAGELGADESMGYR